MSQYIFLQVKEVIRETAEAVTIVFEKPTLIQSYKSGQFLTFLIDINGEKLRRSYSLSSSPHCDQDWAVSVKKVEGGKVSTHLVEKVKAGDIIEVMAPAGVFIYEPTESNSKDIVLIGGGSGITPLYSVIGSALKVEKNSKVYLVYSNRDENSVMLKAGLEKYKTNYPDRFKMIDVFSKPKQPVSGVSGRLDKDKIVKIISDFKTINLSTAHFFVCGPHGMMEESFKALETLKIPKDNIRKENFTSGLPVDHTAGQTNPSDGPITVSIKYGRTLHKVNVPAGQTILEAALDQDIDLPYSCQSGMCTACMGKCKTGQVKMSDPDGLSENEIKQGYVLTCVGRPASADVLIEID